MFLWAPIATLRYFSLFWLVHDVIMFWVLPHWVEKRSLSRFDSVRMSDAKRVCLKISKYIWWVFKSRQKERSYQSRGTRTVHLEISLWKRARLLTSKVLQAGPSGWYSTNCLENIERYQINIFAETTRHITQPWINIFFVLYLFSFYLRNCLSNVPTIVIVVLNSAALDYRPQWRELVSINHS